ncbi:MAG: polymorphic outer membrane protein [Solirubrobacterales bacterium]|nr:polymorphic outer membrane protein [Solirubrobacterales bacterium]
MTRRVNKLLGRRSVRILTISLAIAAIAGSAFAYFTASGSGSAQATVGTLNPPTSVTASATAGSGTVSVSWTAPTGGTAPSGYYVTRVNNADSSTAYACGISPSSTTASTSCSDPSVPDGAYHYLATAVYHTWTAVSGSSNPVTVVNDNTPPYVISIDRADSTPTKAATVRWTVKFSESVTGVDSSDFNLAGAGASGASISGVSGSGATFTVSASTGSDGSLGLNLADDNSIKDAANNPLGTSSGPGDGSFTGQAYAVDKTAPTVTVNQAGTQADPTNALPVHFTAVFNEPVNGLSGGAVTLGGTAGHGSATVTVTQVNATNYDIAVAGLTSDGSIAASLAAGATTDAAGNNSAASSSTDNTVAYDVTAPAPTLVAPADGSFTKNQKPTFSGSSSTGAGDVQTITVKVYSGATTGGSLVQTLTTTASSGTWSVAPSTNLAEGQYTAQASQDDQAGNTGNSTAHTFTVDVTGPTVTVTKVNGNTVTLPFYTNVNVTSIGGTCESLTGTSAVSWLISGTASQSGTQACASSAWTQSLTTALSTEGTYNLSATQTDAAGNSGSSGSQAVIIDKTAPSVAFAAGGCTVTNPHSIICTNGTRGTTAAGSTTSADVATVTVYFCSQNDSASGGDCTHLVGNPPNPVTATNASPNKWSVQSSNLGNGTSAFIEAKQLDVAGNVTRVWYPTIVGPA